MNITPIEWTDYSANPLKYRFPDGRVGWACEKLSPGCKFCYAEKLSTRYGGRRRAGEWNAATMATLTPFLDEAELRKMLTHQPARGKRCFIGDMTDIFGEWVPDDLLDRLFSDVLERRTDVVWQILTKRAKRLHEYLSWRWGDGRIPSRHIWIGTSAEDQQRADERIPILLQVPAAVRFVSAEPLLGPINLRDLQPMRGKKADGWGVQPLIHWPEWDALRGEVVRDRMGFGCNRLDWVIVGGESGKEARDCDITWIESIVQQCRNAGVAPFVKQLGSHPTGPGRLASGADPRYRIYGHKGNNMAAWPEHLRIREFPRVT